MDPPTALGMYAGGHTYPFLSAEGLKLAASLSRNEGTRGRSTETSQGRGRDMPSRRLESC